MKYSSLKLYEKWNMNADLISAVHDKQLKLLNKKYDNGFTGTRKND